MSNVVQMPIERPSRSFKIVVQFERRPDGGIRAWSDQVPGFVLSHLDAEAVLKDIQPALEGILTDQFGKPIITTPLDDIRSELARIGAIKPPSTELPQQREYAALSA